MVIKKSQLSSVVIENSQTVDDLLSRVQHDVGRGLLDQNVDLNFAGEVCSAGWNAARVDVQLVVRRNRSGWKNELLLQTLNIKDEVLKEDKEVVKSTACGPNHVLFNVLESFISDIAADLAAEIIEKGRHGPIICGVRSH